MSKNVKLLKISDFGISKVLDCSFDALSNTCIGTPKYWSPEVCQGRPYSFKADIWSLGCILYELACLRHPFESTNLEELTKKISKAKYSEIPK